ncbi:MAG: Ig-like domain repeat protein, partial [Planctomycetia bacterium]|nr:Ig-like domain repeat protein [Planctomycetia bacterium]
MRLVPWLSGLKRRLSRRSLTARRPRPGRLPGAFNVAAEVLVERMLLSATVAWTGLGDGQNWGDATNWSGGVTPGANDDVTIDVANANPTIIFNATAEIKSLTCKDTLAITGGVLQIDQASSIQVLQQSAGTLTGNGDITVAGLYDWTYGTLSGSGHLNANGGMLLDAAHDSFHILDGRTLNNAGTAVWKNFPIVAYNGAVINNLAGATFDIQSDSDLVYSASNYGIVGTGAEAVFRNAGTLRKTDAQAPYIDYFNRAPGTFLEAAFENTGTVDAEVGTISLESLGRSDGYVTTGQFVGAAGTTLSLAYGDLSACAHIQADNVLLYNIAMDGVIQADNVNLIDVTVHGVYDVTGSTSTSYSVAFTGTILHTGAITVYGGAVDFSSDPASPFTATSLTLLQSCYLTGTTDLTVSGLFHWTSGLLGGSSELNANGGILVDGDTINQYYIKILDGRTINNTGTAIWDAGLILAYDGAVINNLPGATFEVHSGYDLLYGNGLGGLGATATFHNAGTFRKTRDTTPINPSGLNYTDLGDGTQMEVNFDNTGTVDALVGTLTFVDGYTQTAGSTILGGGAIASSSPLNIQGGLLDGNGTISGGVNNAGTTSPGFSPGLINISGDYTQQTSGQLAIELGGTDPGTQYDQLDVSGNVILAGALNLNLLSVFHPTLDQKFVIVKNDGSRAVSGTFAGLAEGDRVSAGGWQFAISYHGDSNGGDGKDVTLTAKTQSTRTVLTSSASASASASTYGDGVTFTATVVPQSSGIPSGTVEFDEVTSIGDFIKQIGTSTLDGSVATLPYSDFAAGTHYIAAKYISTDAGFTDSPLSNRVQLDVNRKSITGVIAACSKVYDGYTTAILFSQTPTGALAADVGNVTLTVGAASFSDPNAGTGKTVT